MSRRGGKVCKAGSGEASALRGAARTTGFTPDETVALRLGLMKCGVGRWVDIMALGLLPGKLTNQLSGQTQRMLGVQSLAAYTGLRLDLDRVRADNALRPGLRKAGVLISEGDTLSREQKQALQAAALEQYGLTDEQLADVDRQLDALRRRVRGGGGSEGAAAALDRRDGDAAGIAAMTRDEKVLLLRRLKADILACVERLRACPGALEGGAPGTEGVAIRDENAAGHGNSAGVQAAVNSTDPLGRPALEGACGAAQQQARGGGPGQTVDLDPLRAVGRGLQPVGQLENQGILVPQQPAKPGAAGKGKKKRKAPRADKEDVRFDLALAVFEANADQLVGMGYKRRKAEQALERCGGQLERAVELLLAGRV